MIGYVSVRVDSSMEVLSVKESDNSILDIIKKYEEADAFKSVNLKE